MARLLWERFESRHREAAEQAQAADDALRRQDYGDFET